MVMKYVIRKTQWRRRELWEEEFSQIVFGGWGNQASEKKGSKRWVRKRTF